MSRLLYLAPLTLPAQNISLASTDLILRSAPTQGR
jgi:hypothetical protein